MPPPEGSAPEDAAMPLQDEPSPVGQQAVKSSALVVAEGSLEPLVAQASHTTASLATALGDVPVPPPRQTLALAKCGPPDKARGLE